MPLATEGPGIDSAGRPGEKIWTQLASIPVDVLLTRNAGQLIAMIETAIDGRNVFGTLQTHVEPPGKFKMLARKAWAAVSPDAAVDVREPATAAGLGPFGFPIPKVGWDRVEYLNWCFCDLDVGHAGRMSAETAAGVVLEMVNAGTIPAPTLLLFSGRGLWAMWGLVDEHNPAVGTADVIVNGSRRVHGPDTAVYVPPGEAGRDVRARFNRVQEALHRRMPAELHADAASTNLARSCRIVGSVNVKSGERVKLLPLVMSDGRLRAYTLADLADRLELDAAYDVRPIVRADVPTLATMPAAAPSLTPPPFALTPDEPRPAIYVVAGDTAGRTRWRKGYWTRLRDLLRILAVKGGGLSEGHRSHGAIVLARWAKMAGYTPDERLQLLATYGERCSPPMAYRDIYAALRGALKVRAVEDGGGRIRHRCVCDLLGLTSADLAAAGCEDFVRTRPVQKRDDKGARHALVRQLYVGSVPPPTFPQLIALLAARGFRVSKPTLTRDLAALGLTCARGPKAGQGRSTAGPLM